MTAKIIEGDIMTTDINIDQEISKAHTAAAGWSLDLHEQSNPFECHAIYLVDYRKKLTEPHLMTIQHSDINKISGNEDPILHASRVVQIQNRINKDNSTAENANQLIIAVASYLKCTHSYRLWVSKCGYEKRFHAVINIYPVKGDKKEGVLRPAFAGINESLLSPNEVEGMSRFLVARDRQLPTYADCKL